RVEGLLLFAPGCKRSDRGPAAAEQAKSLPAAGLPKQLTFSEVPVPPKPDVTPGFMQHGKTVYEQNCAACHGLKGDGKGDAAAFLLPKPRNFVQANYRLRTTPPSQLPTDADLFRSVSHGMPGTPMPPWRVNLNENDRWSVVEYIKTFSPRFMNTNEERSVVISLGTAPTRDEASVAEGKVLFTKTGCINCHGESGHGDGPSAPTLVDDSQTKIRPRDFAKPGMFKGGYATKEIVRTILTGFNGTPMVGFHGTIAESNAWKLAYF